MFTGIQFGEPNLLSSHRSAQKQSRLHGYKIVFMLNSAEHEIFLLITVKMPSVGILTSLSMKNSILGISEPKKLTFLIFLYF